MIYLSLAGMFLSGFILGKLSHFKPEEENEEPQEREATSAEIYEREYKNPVGLFEAVKRK